MKNPTPLKFLMPGWFSVVMGLAGLALAWRSAEAALGESAVGVSLVLGVLALGVEGSPLFLSPWALAFTAFVGVNLFQFGLTNFCPMATILKRLGVPESKLSCSTQA